MGKELFRVFSLSHSSEMIRSLALIFLTVGFSLQCEIIVRNVGQKNFVWHIEYAGNNQYENELGPQDHDNYSCSCLPHDMEIRLPDGFYCYHYLNCVHEFEYSVEVTDYAIYISVGQTVEKICIM